MSSPPAIGALLSAWRRRRHLSQLALAVEAGVSQRHLSCVETGRARPSRELVLTLCRTLEVPLRDRNQLLLAAGYAPHWPDLPSGHPGRAAALAAVRRVLEAQSPHPSLAVDRHWQLITANDPARALMEGLPEALLRPPANVLRASLHPDGLAPRIVNYRQWRAHVLERLHAQIRHAGDGTLIALAEELAAYPIPVAAAPWRAPASDPLAGVAVPLALRLGTGVQHFLSTTTVFGTAVDVTLGEVVIETFLPVAEDPALAG